MTLSLTRALGSLVLLATSAACWWTLAGVTVEWARFSLVTLGVVGALAGVAILLVSGREESDRAESAEVAVE